MNKQRKYMEYRRALGYNNCSNRQYDKYFDILYSLNDVRLSGRSMAIIATLMAEQKEYGESEMYKALKG